ncbi:hypothetical protein [Acinetobacter ihumii]|uniref:hypothetical protein n=1 Tax=Acinetobacter ihumii TaxID=2483802 RepID=UPI0010327AAD|nr:hypothetical protein [Acinetobacter ihumii]
MKLIFIHGAQQQSFNAESLQDHWLNILQLGLNNLDINVPLESLNFAFPYYGDLIHQHALNQLETPLDAFMPQAWQDWHLPYRQHPEPQQIDQEKRLIPLLALHQQELSLTSRLYLFSHLAKDHVLREFVMLLNKFPKLHENMLHRYILEVYLYLANPDFMQDVHQRVMQSFEQDEEYIIVAHSLGTVIAYNLMQQLPENIKVQRFITLASPLAFRVVQSRLKASQEHLQALQGNWYNFYSHEDYLTTFPLDHGFFNVQPSIINQGISTFAHKPHEIIGYLQHPLVVQSIIETICPTEALKLGPEQAS